MNYETTDLKAMDTRQRAALVNSLSGFKSANLVGTANKHGATNLAIMSSAVHLGSHPPLLALVIRPGGEERHTLANIMATGCFTLNHVNQHMVEAAHQTAARYAPEISEFTATGLTPLWQEGFEAPMVAEAHVRIGLRLREHFAMEINATHFVIGEVVFAQLPDASVRDDGSLDVSAAGTVALSGLDAYHTTTLHKRMAYAKADLPPRVLDAGAHL